MALLNACLELEAELRENAYRMLERLGAIIGEEDGPLEDRVRALPEPDLLAALAAVLELGWVNR